MEPGSSVDESCSIRWIGHAWEVYSYIIVGVQKGTDVSMRSFILDKDLLFQEEDIQVLPS